LISFDTLSLFILLYFENCLRKDIEDVDEQEFSLQSVHFHPEFNVGLYLNNDLAVLRIKAVSPKGGSNSGGRGIKFGDRVRAACLPPPNTAYSPGQERRKTIMLET
jgi:hypothetical protein